MGKLMYQMQYSRPDIAQAVQDLAWYMSCGNLKMLEVMKGRIRYVLCTREAKFTAIILEVRWIQRASVLHQRKI
jgi:hypothetical protein